MNILTYDTLIRHAALLATSAPLDTTWWYRQTPFVPKGTCYVLDSHHGPSFFPPGQRTGPRYLVISNTKDTLSVEFQATAVARYIEKANETNG